MTKSLTAVCAAAFVFGVNAGIAQNVKSDHDKAQGQEQKMQEKEKGTTTGAGQQGGQSDRERAKSDDTRSAPSAGGPNSPDQAQSAMNCESKSVTSPRANTPAVCVTVTVAPRRKACRGFPFVPTR